MKKERSTRMAARKLCPIRNDECLGRECAMAVKLDHPLISAYDILWVCGLVNNSDTIQLGEAHVIDRKEKK